jgi:hypothetical protein
MPHLLRDHYPDDLRQVREGDFSPVSYVAKPQGDDRAGGEQTGKSGSRSAFTTRDKGSEKADNDGANRRSGSESGPQNQPKSAGDTSKR